MIMMFFRFFASSVLLWFGFVAGAECCWDDPARGTNSVFIKGLLLRRPRCKNRAGQTSDFDVQPPFLSRGGKLELRIKQQPSWRWRDDKIKP